MTADKAAVTPAGPYMNEDGDWWVPVASMGYLAARRLVKDHMYDMNDRLVYNGRMEVVLDTEHEPCGDDECPGRFQTTAWHFEEQER